MTNPEADIMRVVLLALGLLFAAAAGGAEPDLTECLKERSDAARLACFDRVAAGAAESGQPVPAATKAQEPPAAAAESSPPPPPVADSGASPDEKAEAIDNFGMNRNVAEANDTAPPELDQIHVSIVEIETLRSGKRLFTLDNGQVWMEQSVAKSLRLKPGDEVRIKAGMLGSFKLLDANRRSTRVERIR
jgi:hypothetical protein